MSLFGKLSDITASLWGQPPAAAYMNREQSRAQMKASGFFGRRNRSRYTKNDYGGHTYCAGAH